MMEYLTVGGARIEYTQAVGFARTYLRNENKTWAYPAYDGYPGYPGPEVGPQDLLAVALLNAHQKPVESYYGLERLLPKINEALSQGELTGTLADAGQPTIDALAKLFGVLDDHKTKHVSLTKLSKVLHRKRPELIPLYDRNIMRCYGKLGEKPPVPPVKKRSWSDYTKALVPAIQRDLTSQMEQWNEIAALAPTARITPLRALDIIGWKLGSAPFARPV